MVKPTILGVLVFVAAVVIAAPAALGQSEGAGAPSAVIDNNGVAKANAGGTSAQAGCPTQPPEATAGGVVAKAPCKPAPPPPPPAPKAAPAPVPAPAPPPPPPVQAKAAPAPPPPAPAPPPKALPPTGGASMASLAGLGLGALLVGGGLLARRFTR